MAGFVQRAKERSTKEVVVVASGQPTIFGAHAAAERMRGDVQSPRLKVEADRFGSQPAQCFLLFNGEMPRENRCIRLTLRSANPIQQRN